MKLLAVLAFSLVLLASPANADVDASIDCSGSMVPQPLPVRPSGLPPVAFELKGVGSQHGSPRGTLAHGSDESQAVDQVLLRLRMQNCAPTIADPGDGYVKKTEFDNSPYRFNAGTGFTAAEFEAWMKERGIRIVNGRAVVGGRPAAAEAQPAATAACTPDAENEATLAC